MELQQILSKMEADGWEIADDFKKVHGHFLQYFLETVEEALRQPPVSERAKEYFRNAMEEYSHKQLVKFCEHLNTYAGLEDCRFDFMLVDFKQST